MTSLTPTTARIDLTGSYHPSGSGGNPFDQDLNTTDSPTFDGLDLSHDLDMLTNDISNINNIYVDNDIILNDKLEHTGDGDTYFDFDNNNIELVVGGTSILDMIPTLATFGVDVMFENITATEIQITNTTYTWNMYINATGVLVWEVE